MATIAPTGADWISNIDRAVLIALHGQPHRVSTAWLAQETCFDEAIVRQTLPNLWKRGLIAGKSMHGEKLTKAGATLAAMLKDQANASQS